MTPLTLRADRSGERADQFLARMLPQLSRSAAQAAGRVFAPAPLVQRTARELYLQKPYYIYISLTEKNKLFTIS